MNVGWKSLIVAGIVLVVLSSQVMAQPWGGGPGQAQGRSWQQGRGMGFGPPGRGPMGPGTGPMMQQGGRGARRPRGTGRGGAGAWCPWGGPQAGMPGLFGRRLGLTDEQEQKVRSILEENRSKVLASIKSVLTDEQVEQLERMQGRAGQFRPGMRPGSDGRFGGPMRGRGQRGQMQPGGQGRPGQPFTGGGPGAGRGVRPRMGRNQPQGPVEPPAGRSEAGAGRSPSRVVPPLSQMFDQADTNHDGALTKEEIEAFHNARRGNRPFGQR